MRRDRGGVRGAGAVAGRAGVGLCRFRGHRREGVRGGCVRAAVRGGERLGLRYRRRGFDSQPVRFRRGARTLPGVGRRGRVADEQAAVHASGLVAVPAAPIRSPRIRSQPRRDGLAPVVRLPRVFVLEVADQRRGRRGRVPEEDERHVRVEGADGAAGCFVWIADRLGGRRGASPRSEAKAKRREQPGERRDERR